MAFPFLTDRVRHASGGTFIGAAAPAAWVCPVLVTVLSACSSSGPERTATPAEGAWQAEWPQAVEGEVPAKSVGLARGASSARRPAQQGPLDEPFEASEAESKAGGASKAPARARASAKPKASTEDRDTQRAVQSDRAVLSQGSVPSFRSGPVGSKGPVQTPGLVDPEEPGQAKEFPGPDVPEANQADRATQAQSLESGAEARTRADAAGTESSGARGERSTQAAGDPKAEAGTQAEGDPQTEAGPQADEGGPEPPRPLSEAEIRERVEDYMARLSFDEPTAREAYRELWEVRRDLIPALILQTQNTKPSALREITVLVMDRRKFVRIDEGEDKLVYSIPGMGVFDYDDIAAGRTKSGETAKAILRRFKGFPLGVVLRGALINRFRSNDYPPGDDRRNGIRWWQSFYDRVSSKL